jgi:Rieske 2Fe-2S family protein
MLREELSGTDRYIPQSTLPGRDYYAPEVFDRERERIFLDSWVCAGRVELVAAPGAELVLDVVGEPVLLIREDGALRAFRYVGGYRGSPIALDTWEGFVFIHMASDPPPLLDVLRDDPEEPMQFARFRIGELRIGHRDTIVVDANWKIVADNYNECLHCPTVHPELVTMIPVYRRGTTVEDPESWGVSLRPGATSLTRTGTSRSPSLPGITEVDRHSYYGCFLFPTLTLDITSDVVIASVTLPAGPTRTISTNYYLFRPETIAATGFDPSEVVEFSDLVGDQDTRVCERAQQGMHSRGFADGGVLPLQDRYLLDFKERYLALRGPM